MAFSKWMGGREVLDWERTAEHANALSGVELEYAHKDAIETAYANPEKEGFYHDQASVYRQELDARRAGKRKRGEVEEKRKAKDVEHALRGTQQGPKGGRFYMTPSGTKVYIKSGG